MCFAQLHAQERIGAMEAQTTAKRFLTQNREQNDVTLALSEEIKSEQTGQANLFVFSVTPEGFVIVSTLNEVLAYSLTSAMPRSEDLPNHIAYWIDLYNQSTDYLISHPEETRKQTTYNQEVEPLTTSAWGQGCYHNAVCPADTAGPCQHASAGCVAIAMAQIMYYYKQPLTGIGAISYYCHPYGILSADFGETTYQWEEMTDTLHEANQAVATLVYHCGAAVRMQYSAHQSSSNIASANDAFRQFLGYPSTILSSRSSYDNEAWKELIKCDLDKRHPVYYRGISSIGGHAFVCDGYDSNGLFHFNFGWDGVANGYYTLNNPSGFSSRQSIIHNIYPIAAEGINSDEHGIIHVAPEGRGDGSSWEQATSQLQSAINKSSFGDYAVWVKEGTYSGSSLSDEYAFNTYRNCKLFGGFKGDEPFDYDLSQRDFEAHPTILDGSHTQGVMTVLTYSEHDSILIDGFTIRNGNASQGSGILLRNRAHVKNCIFCNNHALHDGCLSSDSPKKILVEDCEFFGNEANNGGAICDFGNATYQRCKIHDNVATQNGGGVICSSENGLCMFVNCTINNNTASDGGGLYSRNANATFWNCLISNNTARSGGGCHLESGTHLYNCTIVKNEGTEEFGGIYTNQDETPANIRNCIIWGNISPDECTQIGPAENASNCAIQGGSSTANFDAMPQNDGPSPGFYLRFANPDVEAGCAGHGGDWHLQSSSLCIDRGTDVADSPATDLEGRPRLQHHNLDLGAYETSHAAYFIKELFCEENPYYFNGTLLPEPGFYSFPHHGNLYDSLTVVHLFVENVFLKEETCETEPYDFFGTPLRETGLYSTTVDCINYHLDLTVKPLENTYLNEAILECETYDFHGTLLDETGHYSVIEDCIKYDLDLTVNPVPSVFLSESICEGETYYFMGSYLQNAGHYSQYHNCTNYHLDLTVQAKPTLICSNDTLVETGNPAFLTASGADSYLWSTGDTTARIIVFPESDCAYQVTGFSDNGCSVTKSVKVKTKNEVESDDICLFPNPANDKVNLYKMNIDEVVVFNMLGEPIDRIGAQREGVMLDVSHYDNGVYIVMVRVLSHQYYTKLVIQH